MDRIREIILELKERNYQSFDEFYSLTSKLVYYMIAGIVKNNAIIEDLMQDTYIAFLENIDNVSIKNNPSSYLAQIAKNLSINYCNKYAKVDLNNEYFDKMKDPLSEENLNLIDLGIIDYLSGIEKEIVIMHIIGEMRFKDIAVVVDKPLGTVLWLYNKAIKYLRKKIGK